MMIDSDNDVFKDKVIKKRGFHLFLKIFSKMSLVFAILSLVFAKKYTRLFLVEYYKHDITSSKVGIFITKVLEQCLFAYFKLHYTWTMCQTYM